MKENKKYRNQQAQLYALRRDLFEGKITDVTLLQAAIQILTLLSNKQSKRQEVKNAS